MPAPFFVRRNEVKMPAGDIDRTGRGRKAEADERAIDGAQIVNYLLGLDHFRERPVRRLLFRLAADLHRLIATDDAHREDARRAEWQGIERRFESIERLTGGNRHRGLRTEVGDDRESVRLDTGTGWATASTEHR